MLKLEQTKPTHEPIGLKDGGSVILKCSACGKPIAEIRLAKHPNLKDVQSRFIAECCYCGDHSFMVKVEDKPYPGGYGIPNPGDENDAFMKTVVTDIIFKEDAEGSYVLLKTKEYNRG